MEALKEIDSMVSLRRWCIGLRRPRDPVALPDVADRVRYHPDRHLGVRPAHGVGPQPLPLLSALPRPSVPAGPPPNRVSVRGPQSKRKGHLPDRQGQGR